MTASKRARDEEAGRHAHEVASFEAELVAEVSTPPSTSRRGWPPHARTNTSRAQSQRGTDDLIPNRTDLEGGPRQWLTDALHEKQVRRPDPRLVARRIDIVRSFRR